jgi:hypothetical protein
MANPNLKRAVRVALLAANAISDGLLGSCCVAQVLSLINK